MPGHLKVVNGSDVSHDKDICKSEGAGPGEGAVVITVHTGRTVYMNKRMAELLEDFTGDEPSERLPGFIENLVRALRLYRSVVNRAPYLCQYETVLPGRNGKGVRGEITASEILWQGEEAFMIFVRIV